MKARTLASRNRVVEESTRLGGCFRNRRSTPGPRFRSTGTGRRRRAVRAGGGSRRSGPDAACGFRAGSNPASCFRESRQAGHRWSSAHGKVAQGAQEAPASVAGERRRAGTHDKSRRLLPAPVRVWGRPWTRPSRQRGTLRCAQFHTAVRTSFHFSPGVPTGVTAARQRGTGWSSSRDQWIWRGSSRPNMSSYTDAIIRLRRFRSPASRPRTGRHRSFQMWKPTRG